jgi:hypothetical protein
MRPVAFVAGAIVILLGLSATSAANAADERKSAGPDFVVYASAKDADFGSSLFGVLRGKGKVTRLEKADTIEKAVASAANVLVLVLPKRERPKLEKRTLEALKRRKIVGIGYGAAQLFGQLGLEINDGECAHGVAGPPSVTIGKKRIAGRVAKGGSGSGFGKSCRGGTERRQARPLRHVSAPPGREFVCSRRDCTLDD